jgi:hypothetical protein
LYHYNFPFKGPGGYKDPVIPKALPRDLSAMTARLGKFDLALTNQSFELGSQWWMLESETLPYTPEADAKIPVGTVMPGVLIRDASASDRSDIRAGARWKDGYWTLEVSRNLSSASPTDQSFVAGRDLFMWVSVFDHTQTRHTRHVRPVRIRLAE